MSFCFRLGPARVGVYSDHFHRGIAAKISITFILIAITFLVRYVGRRSELMAADIHKGSPEVPHLVPHIRRYHDRRLQRSGRTGGRRADVTCVTWVWEGGGLKG